MLEGVARKPTRINYGLLSFFIIDLDFLGHRYRNHPTFLSDRPYIIIGRDILNDHRITLDGPRLRCTVNKLRR